MAINIGVLAWIWYPWLTYTIWEIAQNVKIIIDNQQVLEATQKKILKKLGDEGNET